MSLQNIRENIDQLDRHILGLLNERMSLVTEIGKLKRERGQAVFAPEREELLLQALEKMNSGPLGRVGLRAIYREILSASRANQSKLRIVYLGEEHSNGFLAARMRFGSSDCYRSEPDWKGAVSSLEESEADVAVVPRPVLCEALLESQRTKPFSRLLRVCGEINLVRELEVDYQIPTDLKRWRGPEQFFMLMNGEDKKASAGKSLFLFSVSGRSQIGVDFEQLMMRNGIRIQSMENLNPSSVRFLCEVEGELNWNKLQEEAVRQWGKTAQLLLLGTYPCPHIYG